MVIRYCNGSSFIITPIVHEGSSLIVSLTSSSIKDVLSTGSTHAIFHHCTHLAGMMIDYCKARLPFLL